MKFKSKLIFIFIFLILLSIQIFSQERSRVDSLNNLLGKVHEPAEKIDIYLNLAKAYKNINADTAIEMARQALLLAEKTKDGSSI